MATLDELSYNILNIARGGLSSDDDRLNIRQIKFWIKYYRAYFTKSLSLKESLRDVAILDPQLVQDLGCVVLEEVDKADCPEVFWNQNVKRASIPKLIDIPLEKSITFVGLADKTTPIIMGNANTSYFKSHQRFTGQMRRAYFIGEYLYISDPFNEDIQHINVRGIFDDPTQITYTNANNEVKRFKDDDEYPMPMSMAVEVNAAIMQRELQMTVNGTNDEINDSREPNSPIDDREQV